MSSKLILTKLHHCNSSFHIDLHFVIEILILKLCNRVGLRWRIVGDMTGWLGSSVVECLHGQRKALGSSPGLTTIFHLLQMAPNIKNPVWRGGLVCMSIVEGYRKFVDFPTGNSWTNLKCPGKCVTG